MRVHKLTFAALAVAASVSLTACGGDSDNAKDDNASSSASSQDSGKDDGKDSSDGESDEQDPAAEPDADSGSGSDSDSGDKGKPDTCSTDELEITAQDSTIGGDSTKTVTVTLKNGGGRDCAVGGYAGVDLNTSEGSISAKRSGQEPTHTVLKDGKETYFAISYPENASGGSGVKVQELVVTPPGERKSVTLKWPGDGTLPVTDKPDASVKIGPIGSAGQGGAN
ncbi:DUF4232 domain-containing protein [Streptomyces sp. XM4193]|uniref:DUF4232 domain-containing protein n=1 Tax=Streptomyces sp. XM4193 TaxID=2929782 RepID=UPI001FF9BE29|nr:DUF4232 domain-containing protein [Streptomyces sp. XM4193]MCK1796905.1 DUF4232 domain-containing protein [Streptomyces sp. XM4193]